jgi:hypothetical protein
VSAARLLWALGLLAALGGCRFDRDGDGFVGRDDCDDDDPLRYPGAPERCDGVDDDCDHLIDEVDDVPPWFADADGDGHGDPDVPLLGCPREGGVPLGDDCDDGAPTVHPGAPESCNGIDDDCDGLTDESPEPAPFADRDGDGVGAEPTGCVWFAVEQGGDCDDDDDTVFPGAQELCDGLDNDCDGQIDGEDDADADGVRACEGDCDDDDATRSPRLVERCNGIDDDCDGVVDGDDTWFDPRWPVRVPVQVSSAVDTTRPVVLDLDGPALLDAVGSPQAFDPAHLRVVDQRCTGAGLIELPATFLDGQWGLDQPGDPTDPTGDGRGALVVLVDLDGDLATAEPFHGVLPLALYLGGPEPAAPWPTDLVVDGTVLAAADHTTRFVDASGGLAELSVAEQVVASQADAAAGNGLRTSAGSLSAQLVPGQALLADDSAVTAGVVAVAERSNGAGAVFSGYGYRRFAGRPELWVRQRLVSTEPTTIAGADDRTAAVRPWQAVLPAAGTLEQTVGPDALAGHVTRGTTGLAWAWLAPPTHLTHVDHDDDEHWLAANDVAPCCDGTSGGVSSGTPIVDGALLVVHPHLGPLDAEAWADSLRIEVLVGPPQRLPGPDAGVD